MSNQNFHVYKSSAGSGKTFTLVKEYLKIVLRNPDASRQILAITFTNAAAAEMKARIIKVLKQIASLTHGIEEPDARQLIEKINAEWQNEGVEHLLNKTIISNAQQALKMILHRYADFAVSTIDSFVHRLVRTFAFDLRIPLNFEVELDAKALLSKAIDMLISRVGTDEKLTKLLIAYMISQTDDEADTRIEIKIAELARTLTDEDSAGYINQLKNIELDAFLQIAAKLKASTREFEKSIEIIAEEAMALIAEKNLSASDFYQSTKGIYAYFKNLSDGKIKEKLEPNSYVIKTLEEDKWISGKCTVASKQIIEEIKPHLTGLYNKINKKIALELETYLCHKAVLSNIYPLAVLNEVENMLSELKSEEVLLHISDFNKRIGAIVSEQPVPFIYERLGERYLNYMIDEFQDTSALQWQNLLPLVANSLAGGNMSLVVGDGKQAIYRFRNGDVEQFAMLPRLSNSIRSVSLADWQVTLQNNYREALLNTNWRSAKSIVTFNNSFFEHAMLHLPVNLRPIYEGVQQKVRPNKPEGYVEISFVQQNETQALQELMTENVLDIINKCLDAGHPLSDITVLCRSNNDASRLAAALLANQIPVISAESLLLGQSKEVNFFISVLRLLNYPGDMTAAVEIIAYLLDSNVISKPGNLHDCLKTTGLFSGERKTKNISLHEALEQIISDNGTDFSFRSFAHQNIYDTCESILGLFFAQQEPPNPFVAFFMDAVFDYSEKHIPAIDDFLCWWDEKGSIQSIVVPEGLNAVQVMTVHKSKGLQFPVVIHPFAYQQATKPTKTGFWTNGEQAGVPGLPAAWLSMNKSNLARTPFETVYDEEMGKTLLDLYNIMYVAFTRPSQKLFILTKTSKTYKINSVHGLLKSYLESTGRWNDATSAYSFGTFEQQPSMSDDQKAPEESPYRRLISEPWTRALRMSSHHLDRSSVLGHDDALERGNLLHRAMEQIISANDVEPVLQSMLDKGEITDEIAREWRNKINELIAHPEVSSCFVEDAAVKREAGIFDADGNFYRPDRVVFLKDRCVIIDYKSGRRYEKHKEQMDAYAGILKKMGYPRIKAILLYLDKNIVEILNLHNSCF